jgi:PAS domain S-box-containing protein
VLLVEDSEDDALLIVRELERGGYEPEYERVETPEAMKKALAEWGPWDVVISDYRMPQFRASEALAIFRGSGLEAPFIVVSGMIGEELAVEAMKAGAYDYVMKDNLVRLSATVQRSLEEFEGQRERRRAERELRHQDAILETVRFAAERFLGETSGWEESVRTVLKRLGEAAEASRVYVFENYVGEDGELWATQRYEWVAPGVSAQIDNTLLKALPYRAAGFGRWEEVLGQGDLVHGHTRDLPESEQPELRAEDILSIVVVPIFVEGEWWGFVGFDECFVEREWSAAEMEALKAAASTLGAAVRRRRAEEALRESERLYRTVIEQVTENICLVDVETRFIVGANPAFQEALGYTQEELQSLTLYDIVAHDKESVDRNVQRALKEGRGSIGQRKYQRKDGSLLDVEASGSLILRNGRETLCIVAHDITERARVQELLEERVATLSRVASNVALDLPIVEMLDALAESAVSTSTAVACIVALSDENTGALHPVGAHGLAEGSKPGLDASWRAGAPSPTIEAFRSRQPVLVRNVRRFLLANVAYSPIHHLVREALWDTAYVVPLISRDRALGALNLLYLPDREPGEDEKAFLKAVADQSAIVVENARLFAQARDKATLEERQRLARELHDSVSQALYGITLGTKTAHALLKRNPEQVADSLEYVLSLAKAGQAEMRALIFELRPESLEKEGLAAALEKQADALKARHEIEVVTTLCSEPEASPEVKEAIYRIGQEALHNTVKHARASNVEIRMECTPEQIILEMIDDGVGFEARGDFPGHLGLRSMRERASRLGGTLEVNSGLGKGTHIRAWVPVRRVDVVYT